MKFAILFNDAFAWLATITGTGPSQSSVTVHDDHVDVRKGWALKGQIPRSAIRLVEQPSKIPFRFGMGVHGWDDTWAVNGSNEGGVTLTLDPGVKARVLFIPVAVN